MVSITQKLENWTLPHKVWKTGAPLPMPLLEGAVAGINGKLYVFGGFTLGWRAVKKVYVYNLEANEWTQLTEMPTAVTHINATVDRSIIWFAGGFVGDHPGAATDEVWQYDTSNNSWTEIIPLPQKRASGGFQIINGELHYFGGFAADRDTTCPEHWSLPVEGGTEWIERSPLPAPRGHLASVAIDGKIYAMGGQHRHDTNPVDVDSVHVYDSAEDSWSELPRLPEPRSHFEWSTFSVEDYILIIGGRNNQNPQVLSKNLQEILDHQNDKLIDDLPLQLFLSLKYLLKDSPYYTNIIPRITVYDVKQNTWRELTSLPTHIYAPMANVISNWLVIAGGSRNRQGNMQTRTLLNQSLLDLVKTQGELQKLRSNDGLYHTNTGNLDITS